MLTWLASIGRRLKFLTQPRQHARDLDDELAFHVEMREARLRETGLTGAHARARIQFGNHTSIKEDMRRAWQIAPALESLARDIRYAVRSLLHNRTYAVVSIVTLALAIGLGTSMFSVLEAALFRPVPFVDADRLVMVWTERPAQGLAQLRSAYANIERWREPDTSLTDVAFADPASALLAGGADPRRVSLIRASPNLFSVLGVPLIAGRAFTWEEAEAGEALVIISRRIADEEFGGSAAALGSTVALDGKTSVVIGVVGVEMPLFGADIWEPHTRIPNWDAARQARGTGPWFVVARLEPGAGVTRAEAEATARGRALEPPSADPSAYRVAMTPIASSVTSANSRLALWLLFGAVLSVLLVALVNVTSLSVARGVGREREISLRLALGANRRRIIRQLMAEGLVLALASGTLGLALAVASFRLVASRLSTSLPGLEEPGLNVPVLLFALAVSGVTSMVVGLAPVATLLRKSLARSIGGERGSAAGVNTRRARRALIRIECSVAVVLLIGAGLLLRSLSAAERVDLGFNPDGVLSLAVSGSAVGDEARRQQMYASVIRETASVPGVRSAGLVSEVLINGEADAVVTIDDEGATRTLRTRLRRDEASAGYFEALSIPVLRGRLFRERDRPGADRVAVISASLEARLWPGATSVGRRFKFGPIDAPGPWFTVVGVVGDMRRQGYEAPMAHQMFESVDQNPPRLGTLVVKAMDVDSRELTAAIRAAVRHAAPDVTVYGVQTLDGRLGSLLAMRRMQATLVAGFALFALMLSGIGIYGLIHYTVSLRQKELAIRRAIGATTADIYRLVVGEGLSLGLTGLIVGLLAALALGRVVSRLLFGVTATDPLTFVAVTALVTVVSIAACYLPARRAANVRPVDALRQ